MFVLGKNTFLNSPKLLTSKSELTQKDKIDKIGHNLLTGMSWMNRFSIKSITWCNVSITGIDSTTFESTSSIEVWEMSAITVPLAGWATVVGDGYWDHIHFKKLVTSLCFFFLYYSRSRLMWSLWAGPIVITLTEW